MARSKGQAFEWRSRATSFYTSRSQVRPHTAARDGAWTDLCDKGLQDSARTSMFADRMLISLRKPWELPGGVSHPAGTLLSVGIPEFCEKGTGAKFDVLFTPTSRCSLSDFDATKNYLVLQMLDNVCMRLQFWRYDTVR